MSIFLPRLTLILGGARSGKSRHAERLVLESGLQPCYLATGQGGDAEMAARIAAHRARRGERWRLVEEPLELATALRHHAAADCAVLVDCLTLWVTNLLLAERDIEAEVAGLTAILQALPGPVVLVSNEVGLGIVPIDALTRAFVDATGALHQRLAAMADRVDLVTAGLPLRLKPEG
ncbi:MAG: bifunctional adenosylcobinamide kinase/adenosylcobinamide-phosphate guanylyltransferase [Geminicoccaceae bacterium]|nr:bifunctional adenosylcobinamide kinase/adenosylcobinamide-phosphate guanylyltransferase [Geminicoccaceae bacterium]MCB9966605.1 bifunctional adenosylcobinamide kinase/adenosylcobinamide-phosphate guanylyltransferase [Geminicoccaceae bacterium]HRY25516.1 bifunctional adenosylcobinamide kinase/adenosylcobinamide-phosphate guanylyltransferase [Geminicoccaceae bacterium]